MVDFERVYVDSSVILRRLFGQTGAVQATWKLAISSELLRAEVLRSIDNARATGLSRAQVARYRDEALHNIAGVELIPVSSMLLRRVAEPFPAPVRTLDAIHLATALVWSETVGHDLVLLTHDRQLGVAAKACGLDTYPRLIP